MHRPDKNTATGFDAEGSKPLFKFARAFIVISDTCEPAGLLCILRQHSGELDC